MGRPIQAGSADVSVYVRVVDSTTGVPETAVAYDTTGVDLWYMRAGADHVSLTEITQTAAGAHATGGFVHIADGVCRLDLPDSACIAGAASVTVGGTFTGMIVIGDEYPIVGYDPTADIIDTAGVNAAVDTAIEDYYLDHLFATDYDATSKPGVATAWANEMVVDDVGVVQFSVNALENAPSGSGASAETISDAVWDELRTGHDTAGSFGALMIDVDSLVNWVGTNGANLDAVQWNSAWDAEVESEVTNGLVALNLDHLAAAATAGADMTTEVVDNSILSRMLANGNTSAFDPSTDGLQPLRDSLATSTELSTQIQTDMQADPTQFHVNVMEVNGTSQTANDNSADINTLVTGVDLNDDAITAAKIDSNAITATTIADDSITAAKIDSGAIVAGTFAAGAVDSAALSADAVATITASTPLAFPKNVALSNFQFWLFDSTNHAPLTGATVAVEMASDAAASFTGATNTPATEVAEGLYRINLTQAEMNYDTISFHATAAGADEVTFVIRTYA